MTPQIKYIVGDMRRKPVQITPSITIGDVEFVATSTMTQREAKEITRSLVAGPHNIIEQWTKRYHEEVDISDIKEYDE